MPKYDRQANGYRVFVGGVDPRVGKVDIEQEFERFGPIADVWVARNPPGFAFIVFKYAEDADRAVRRMDGSRPFGSRLRVEHAVNNKTANRLPGGRCRNISPEAAHVHLAHPLAPVSSTNPQLDHPIYASVV
uniref:RRM domain-containing protein n=1 Tax=Schistosoma japonicum TaxID=6182 RepID=Q5DBQ6_SCHJA|nr:unknown [Schistosoma japonicum]